MSPAPMPPTAELVVVDVRGHVAVLTLNRPDALNALNQLLMDQLEAALDRFAADDLVRVVVIAGSARAFAAGADIKEMDGLSSSDWNGQGADAGKSKAAAAHLGRWDKLGRFPKPTIAAVSGFALGGGCELALACDMIVASETAQFGQPEILIGVIPGAGGTVRLARMVGKQRAMELALTGRRFTAQEAYQLGLVTRLAPPESWLDEALKLADQVAALPPLAAQAAKSAVLESFNKPLDEALSHERRRFYALFDTQDQKEGMKAFVEKRKPVWSGR